ncbi:MAG: alpha/beta hydrolase [Usitatibacteraceae bacterium]
MNVTFCSVINSTIVRNNFMLPLMRSGTQIAATFAPGWVARTAARRFVTPPHHAHTPPELRSLQGGRRLTVSTPIGALAAWQFGDRWRPAIVMSHGWGGRGAQFREFVPVLLDAGFQVWLFDHVSHGMSEGQEAPITDFAEGLVAVVGAAQAEGVSVAGFVGHSLGCAGIGIALKGALRTRDGQDHLRVVQIAPPASLIRYSRFFARVFGLPERIRAAMQWRLEQRIGVNWQEFEMPNAVADMTAKALVIHDQHDADVRIESGLTVARSWPDARFKRTLGLGHRKILRDRDVIAATADFLADRVEFLPPPALDEWSAFPGPSPIY